MCFELEAAAAVIEKNVSTKCVLVRGFCFRRFVLISCFLLQKAAPATESSGEKGCKTEENCGGGDAGR